MFHVKRSREGEMFHVKQKRVAFRCPAGACLLCRLPTMPLVYFLSPIPRPPSPPGKGEIFLFSYARGSAPCIPGVEPARHWLFLPRQCFSVPIPPTPFPAGRGRPKLFHARGSAPCIPGPGLSPGGTGSIGGAGAPAPPAAKPAQHWLAGRLRPLHPRD